MGMAWVLTMKYRNGNNDDIGRAEEGKEKKTDTQRGSTVQNRGLPSGIKNKYSIIYLRIKTRRMKIAGIMLGGHAAGKE
jgi:hypothetical protein